MDSKNTQEIFTEISKIPSQSLRAKLLFVNKLTEDRAKFQEDTYDAEYLNLKKKYDVEYEKLANEISQIVSGEKIPTVSEEELKNYNLHNDLTQIEKGIPDYWATVLTNSKDFYQVNEKDEKILKFLRDVRVNYFEDKLSFSIEFLFNQNEFFTNEKLTKTYIFDLKNHQCKKIEGCVVNWTSEDKIPNKIKTVKNIRKGKSNICKEIEKEVESFFDIFKENDTVENTENESIDSSEGEFFKNDLIGFSLEYYLNLVDLTKFCCDDENCEKR